MAALPSANESPLYVSLRRAGPRRTCVAQKLATSLPACVVEGGLAVLDQLLAAGLRRVERVEVEPGLEELAGRARARWRPGARLAVDDLARWWPGTRRRSTAAGSSGSMPGLLEQVLVVEDHHRVGLPRHLVELPVRRLVLVGRRSPVRSSMYVVAPREVVQRDQAALLLELRHRRRRGVEDQAGRVARGDRGADDLLGALAGRDLLGGHLLLGVRGVPVRDHRLAPGDLLGVVREPDLDRPLRGDRVSSSPPNRRPHTPTSGPAPAR